MAAARTYGSWGTAAFSCTRLMAAKTGSVKTPDNEKLASQKGRQRATVALGRLWLAFTRLATVHLQFYSCRTPPKV